MHIAVWWFVYCQNLELDSHLASVSPGPREISWLSGMYTCNCAIKISLPSAVYVPSLVGRRSTSTCSYWKGWVYFLRSVILLVASMQIRGRWMPASRSCDTTPPVWSQSRRSGGEEAEARAAKTTRHRPLWPLSKNTVPANTNKYKNTTNKFCWDAKTTPPSVISVKKYHSLGNQVPIASHPKQNSETPTKIPLN